VHDKMYWAWLFQLACIDPSRMHLLAKGSHSESHNQLYEHWLGLRLACMHTH
jgi:hypothetical protein